MRFRKKKEDESHISIAPLIDIVFLLLIFFLVTSHYDIASGVRINLPRVAGKILNPEDENRITLIVDKTAKVYLEGKVIDYKELKERLEGEVKEKGLINLILQADSDVRHGNVVRIMDLAKSAGVNSIIIAAQLDSDELF